MERRLNPKAFGHDSKEEIIDKAKKGAFNNNPLLATPHALICKTCGYKQKITYLHYLKTGQFELGKTRIVEVVHAAPTISGLRHTMERVTPIIIRIKCKRCGTEISCSPISIEYLLFTTAKKQKLNQMYV